MKKFNIITILVVILCLFFSTFAVFAEPEEETQEQTELVTEPETEPSIEEPTTEDDNFIPSDYDTTEYDEPDNTTQEDTTRKQTPSTTRKPVPSTTRKNEPTTTRKPTTTRETGDDDNNDEPVQNPVVIPDDEEDLPEGSFYVYLERNNGERRLKALLTKPELVSEPDTPVREGFIFEGWYADPEFEKKWNFYTDMAEKGTVIYAKWSPDPNAVVYKVKVTAVEGGTIQVNPSEASVGEPVLITVNPDEGMRLVAGSVTINGKSTDILNFNMPAKDVVISARFEVIPESEQEPVEKKSPLPVIIGVVAILVIIGLVVFFILRRRDDFSEDEIDENGTIIDKDDDMSWVDESIVVEDGFKDGEKVVGNFIPEDDFAFAFDDDNENDND